jgi:two-component system, OmpR family, response regulator
MRSMRILYIDDNPSQLEMAARALTGEGYAVTTCATVAEAKPQLPQCDIVIIDYYMPGLNGQQVLAELRAALPATGLRPVFYLYTSDFETGSTYREMNFDGRIILKGNTEALVKQVNAAARALSLRRLRPD